MKSWKVMRWPVVFGSVLGAYFTVFSFRHIFFEDDIKQAHAESEQVYRDNRARVAAMTGVKFKKVDNETEKL